MKRQAYRKNNIEQGRTVIPSEEVGDALNIIEKEIEVLEDDENNTGGYDATN
jgi:hypothetical protein